jgi:hypothetical protein
MCRSWGLCPPLGVLGVKPWPPAADTATAQGAANPADLLLEGCGAATMYSHLRWLGLHRWTCIGAGTLTPGTAIHTGDSLPHREQSPPSVTASHTGDSLSHRGQPLTPVTAYHAGNSLLHRGQPPAPGTAISAESTSLRGRRRNDSHQFLDGNAELCYLYIAVLTGEAVSKFQFWKRLMLLRSEFF